MSTECVPLSIRTPPPLKRRIDVPAAGHVDRRCKDVRYPVKFADFAGRDSVPGDREIVHKPKFGRHRQHPAAAFRGFGHHVRVTAFECETVFRTERECRLQAVQRSRRDA